MTRLNSGDGILSRRAILRGGGSALTLAAVAAFPGARAMAQSDADAQAGGDSPVGGQEAFSFDWLVERARKAAAEDYVPPEPLGKPFSDLNYDDYRRIQFREESAVWAGEDAFAVLHAYHPGWLFDTTVSLYEVVDGEVTPLTFSTEDFRYYSDARGVMAEVDELPGVAGFRLNAPLNAPGQFDEVVSFLGASYFRALGKDNRYGLSARGLAVNTATSAEEEFPSFTAFWLERPEPDADHVVFYASLESESLTGAYKFVVKPGRTTTMDVTLRLFFRRDIEQLGLAPLTSMYLFGPNDRGVFDDYRNRVHDSEALIVNTEERAVVRVLNNPPRLANSYMGAMSPQSFGLVQRHRDFDDYLDAGAHYESRPSLMVEPVGAWGRGAVRLIEIPSDLEANDNIVAFWVPEAEFAAGDELDTAYRLYWGMSPPGAESDLAQVSRTLAGHGGVSGVDPAKDRRKFVIDFLGGPLAELGDDQQVKANITVSNGKLEEEVLQTIDPGSGLLRLVVEVSADAGAVVEMSADLWLEERRLSETWIYQWLRE